MKTREAVALMKKGKILEGLFVQTNNLSVDEFNPVIGFNNDKTISGFYDLNCDEADDIMLNAFIKDIDWKIVEEKNPAHFCNCGEYLGFRGFCSEDCHNKYYGNDRDWNLNQQMKDNDDCGWKEGVNLCSTQDVKKCRDLIIKDIEEKFNSNSLKFKNVGVDFIVNKRFGDLK